jgi:hypothetical protein
VPIFVTFAVELEAQRAKRAVFGSIGALQALAR